MDISDINGRLEIQLPVSLDLPSASELRDVLLDALAHDSGAEIVLKAAAVERASTAAVQVLLAGAAAFKGAARHFAIEGANEPLAAVFRHLGLAAEFDKLVNA